MKKNYSSPELEIVKLYISGDILNNSDPMTNVGEGSGSGVNPGVDPWGDLPN